MMIKKLQTNGISLRNQREKSQEKGDQGVKVYIKENLLFVGNREGNKETEDLRIEEEVERQSKEGEGEV